MKISEYKYLIMYKYFNDYEELMFHCETKKQADDKYDMLMADDNIEAINVYVLDCCVEKFRDTIESDN